MLSYLRPDSGIPVPIQDTEFTNDLLGRYACSTFDEATCGVHTGCAWQ